MGKFLHQYGREMLGQVKLREVRRYAESLELPSCPFCGGEPEVILGASERSELYDLMPLVMIRCSQCHCTTNFIDAGYHEPEGNSDPMLWGEDVKVAMTALAERDRPSVPLQTARRTTWDSGAAPPARHGGG